MSMPYKPNEIVRKLLKYGFEIKRQSRSHLILRHPDGRQTYVAVHTKDMPEGTFKSILKQANISLSDFDKI
jgi:predicted RNA binding protein YcfA (HicA-like mRNA interferase family)